MVVELRLILVDKGDKMSFISLVEKNHICCTNVGQYKSLNIAVQNIVYELLESNSQLINDVETGSSSKDALDSKIVEIIDRDRISVKEVTREQLIKSVQDYIWGYGVLQKYLQDPFVSDIRVVDYKTVVIKRMGRKKTLNIDFGSPKALLSFAKSIVIKNGGVINQQKPIALVKDIVNKLRLDVCIPPVNTQSASIVIRKHREKAFTLEELLSVYDMFNLDIYEFLLKAISARLNIIWCGQGGSGKTTFMASCINEIPHEHSLLLMQETEEIFPNHPDCISQQIKRKIGETDTEFSLRDLTTNGLLMGVDRMAIGELKGAEAMDFFNAIYTGHEGSFTTVHAPSSQAALDKIIHLMKYSNTDLSREVLLEMLANGIDLVIFLKQFKVHEITEIVGYDHDKKTIVTNPLYKYEVIKEDNGMLEGHFIKLNDYSEKIAKKIKIIDSEFEE